MTHDLASIDEEVIFENVKALGSSFKKTEYNCVKKHHHNPNSAIKLAVLKKGEVRGYEDGAGDELTTLELKKI